MLKFNLGAHELHINENFVSGKIVFNDDKKRKRSNARDYFEDFIINFVNYHDINIYDGNEIESFYDSFVCKSLRKNVLTFKVGYCQGILYQLCNHFHTYVKNREGRFFVSKKYTFDHFKIQHVTNYEDNKEVLLASDYLEYTLCKDTDGIWYLSDIFETSNCEYASLQTKLEVLKSDLSRFIVDNKMVFDTKHLQKIYSELIIKPLLDIHCSEYTDNIISEKLLVLDHIINIINNDKKVNSE